MIDPGIEEENRTTLAEQIVGLNEQLLAASLYSTNQAFMLGITVGLIPVGLFVVVVYFLLQKSLVGALFTALLMGLGLVAFANLAAYIARARVMQRVYKDQIAPEIELVLAEYQTKRPEFDNLADEILELNAPLRLFCTPKPHSKETADNHQPDTKIEGKP